ncbi:MAG: 50S ribosomal protein L40e [Candidatus Pacearchaeota archaeon]|nr:MAG: 50S ribosomal protein L40e [Candidatus Pacearchaeota archaeon]
MAKIEAAYSRIFKEVFVCKRCGAKIKAQSRKVAEGKVRCRKCKSTALRPKSKKTSKG